jgi:phosphoglycerol geranylgeranyltransferase
LKKHKHLHFSLIDPASQTADKAGLMARLCELYGSDAIMVGGSTVRTRQQVHETVAHIKAKSKLPVILFPNSAEAISANSDYIFFMELLNSMDLRFRGGEQVKGAPLIKRFGLKTISMGYLVISTSKTPTTVERAAKLDKIGMQDIEKAIQYALYAEMIGMSCVYFEAGSGAEHPVPNEMIKAVRREVKMPLIVGGGIRTPEVAVEKIKAGADVVVTGTILENDSKTLEKIIKGIRGL